MTSIARRKGSHDEALMIEPKTMAVEMKKYMPWMMKPKAAARSGATRGYLCAHLMSAAARSISSLGYDARVL